MHREIQCNLIKPQNAYSNWNIFSAIEFLCVTYSECTVNAKPNIDFRNHAVMLDISLFNSNMFKTVLNS